MRDFENIDRKIKMLKKELKESSTKRVFISVVRLLYLIGWTVGGVIIGGIIGILVSYFSHAVLLSVFQSDLVASWGDIAIKLIGIIGGGFLGLSHSVLKKGEYFSNEVSQYERTKEELSDLLAYKKEIKKEIKKK